MKQPNWKEWKHTPDVRLWQACALSLNIDPHSMKLSPHGWMAGTGTGPLFEDASFPDKDTREEYELRMRLLLANLPNREYFSPGSLNMGAPGNHNVRLAEFAKWALIAMEWQGLPPELAALTQQTRPSIDGKNEIRKKNALVAELLSIWPTIEQDLSDASRKGGLSEVAWAFDENGERKHGYWAVQPALIWATQRNKLNKRAAQSYVSSNDESALSPMLRVLLGLD